MKRFLIICLTTLVLILVIASGAACFLMDRFEVSLPTLINKIAAKLSNSEQSSLLIKPTEKYANTSLKGLKAGEFPRILTRELQGWKAHSPANFFIERVQIIKDKHLGYRLQCASKRLNHSLNCFMTQPSEQSFERLLAAMNNYRPIPPTVSGNKSNAWLFAFVIDIVKASDWLSEQQRQRIDQRVIVMLQQYLQLLDNDGASLWHSRVSLGAQAFLLATVLDRKTLLGQRLYHRALGHFNQTFQAISMTETWPGGYNYWINNRAFVSMLAFSAYANAQREPSERAKVIATVKRIGLAHIHFVRPDFKVAGWADEGPRIDLKDETARVTDLIAQLTKEPVFYYFSQAIRQRYGNESYYRSYRWLLPWLYAPEHHPGTSRRVKRAKTGLLTPLAPLLKNNLLFGKDTRNHLAIRSGWSDEDTVISYQAGHIFSHHQHYNAGHFTLFKGTPLLVDAAQYNGSVRSDRRKHIDIRTLSKNSVLIDQPGEVIKPNYRFVKNVSAGGQRVIMPLGSAITSVMHWRELRDSDLHLGAAKLISYSSKPLVYATISSDLTSAYNSTRYSESGNSAKVKQVIRHFSYLNKYDLLLTYDKILSTDESYRTKWLAHTVNKPRIAKLRSLKGSALDGISSSVSHKIKIHNGIGQLELDILAPELATTTVVGGPQYQHYVEDDGDSRELDGHFFSDGFKVKRWYDPSPWRIEISPIDQQALTRYVVAMQPRLTASAQKMLVKHSFQSSNGGSAQLGPLLILWPHGKTSWYFTLSEGAEDIAIFLDKPRRLTISTKGNTAIAVDGKVGFNLLSAKLLKDAQIFVTSAR